VWDDPDIEQEYEFDRDRHALAQLLQVRRNHLAAKTVAVSRYSSAYVGEGKSQVTLAVPAELYDAARNEFREAISAACADIVGGDGLGDVVFRVLRPPYDEDWVANVVNAVESRWVASERVDTPAIDQAAS
jgi:hypothetical protein